MTSPLSSRRCPARPTSSWPGATDAPASTTSANRHRGRLGRAGDVRLLAMVLAGLGIKARSWQGWQVPIETNEAHGSAASAASRPRTRRGFCPRRSGRDFRLPGRRADERPDRDTRPRRLGHSASPSPRRSGGALRHLQPMSTASTPRPRIVPKARRMDRIAFEEMLEMASSVRKCYRCARRACHGAKVKTYVRSSFDDPPVPIPEPSSATRKTSWNSRSSPASPTPRTRRRSTLRHVPDKPGVAAASSCRWPRPTSMST